MTYEFKIRPKFGFFHVNEDYVEYLKEKDSNVCDNYNEARCILE